MEKLERLEVEFSEVYEFLFEKYRYKCAWGGRGGGRSWAFARALIIIAAQQQLRILCAREFQRSIKDSVHKLLADQVSLLKQDAEYTIRRDGIFSRCGSEFMFAGLKHNIGNIKSMEGIDICWVEEADKVSQDSWDYLIPTIRKDIDHGGNRDSEIWLTFNPDLETDPTYKRFILHPPPESKIIKTSWRDNNWFPNVLKKEKDYMYTVDPERAAWIWEGECRSHSDAQIMKNKWIIDVFEPPVNNKGQYMSWFGPYYGADWGFARDPTVIVRFWINPSNDYFDLMIEYEAQGVGVDIEDTPEMFNLVPESKSNIIYADSARPETINHMINKGYHIKAAPKWPGCVEDGITWIRSARKIVIHERCKHMIDEARNYI
ncbi:hypothetical protein LCGC14_2255520 [marine sediment metagenome]|uniref:Phage terminase large subunit N-terminal domain-containing protein n=1 Tax=marine sediment metagenome TaxID=412755 RepID=A0A0F9D138_9ZZZZ